MKENNAISCEKLSIIFFLLKPNPLFEQAGASSARRQSQADSFDCPMK
jgi:hypothetical protein